MKSKGKGPPRPPAPSTSKGKGPRGEDAEAVHTACQFDDEPALQAFFDGDSPLDANRCFRRGLAPLHTAASNGSVRAARLLLTHGAFINAANSWNESPLHLAVAGGHIAVVTELIQARANLEAADKWRRTPLRVAREIDAEVAVKALLAAGALDSSADDLPSQPLPVMNESQRAQKIELTAELMSYMEKHSSEMRSEPTVKHIFCSEAAPRMISSGPQLSSKRALSKLVEYPGDPQMVSKMLADPSVDPAGRDAFALTALHKFAAWDKVDLMKLLLPHLDDTDINAADGDNGFTPLHHAISMGAIHSLEFLLTEPRVSRNAEDKAGRTAREVAESTPGLQHLVEFYDRCVQADQESTSVKT